MLVKTVEFDWMLYFFLDLHLFQLIRCSTRLKANEKKDIYIKKSSLTKLRPHSLTASSQLSYQRNGMEAFGLRCLSDIAALSNIQSSSLVGCTLCIYVCSCTDSCLSEEYTQKYKIYNSCWRSLVRSLSFCCPIFSIIWCCCVWTEHSKKPLNKNYWIREATPASQCRRKWDLMEETNSIVVYMYTLEGWKQHTATVARLLLPIQTQTYNTQHMCTRKMYIYNTHKITSADSR